MILAFMVTISLTISVQAAEEVFPVSTVAGKMLRFEGTPDGLTTTPYQGKIVFIEFWGTWCGPCLLSIPHHEELQEQYKDKLRIVAFETTPTVTKDELQKYVANPSKYIDMKRVSYYLNEKAKTKARKDSLAGPIKLLKEFKASGKKITYDVVSSADAGGFVDYIGGRAGWEGYIPFLLILDGNGKVVSMVPGMPSKEKLDNIIKSILKDKNSGIK